MEIILNLKELVVRFLNPSLQTVTLLLKAEGPKEVKARDFLPVADVEIMNPDLHIATLEEGVGSTWRSGWTGGGVRPGGEARHQGPDQRHPGGRRLLPGAPRGLPGGGHPPGAAHRPGQAHPQDLDRRLRHPPIALNQAVEILREHLTYFSNPQAAAVAAPEEAKEPEAPPEQEEELDLPLEELGLSTRVLHSLKEEGIESVRALLALNLKDLKNIPGIGERSLEEIKEALEKKGFTLKE